METKELTIYERCENEMEFINKNKLSTIELFIYSQLQFEIDNLLENKGKNMNLFTRDDRIGLFNYLNEHFGYNEINERYIREKVEEFYQENYADFDLNVDMEYRVSQSKTITVDRQKLVKEYGDDLDAYLDDVIANSEDLDLATYINYYVEETTIDRYYR